MEMYVYAQEKATGLPLLRGDILMMCHMKCSFTLPSLANVRIPVSVAQIKIQSCGRTWGNIHFSMYGDGVLFKTSKLSTSVKEQHHAPCKCAVDAGCQQPNITCICVSSRLQPLILTI